MYSSLALFALTVQLLEQPLQVATGPGTARAMFLDYSRQGAQCLVGFAWSWERGGDIRFEHNDNASRSIARCKLVLRSTIEIVLGKDFFTVRAFD